MATGRGESGWPGMRVESVEETPDGAVVTTTGARFEFGAGGAVRARARLPGERPVAALEVDGGDAWSVVESSAEAARLDGGGVEASVREDSVLEIRVRRPLRVRIVGEFAAEYAARKSGAHVLLDRQGGFGVYPLPARTPRAVASSVGEWTLVYDLRAGDELWVAVFPARARSRARHAQSLAHEGRPSPLPEAAHPSDELIADSARHCGVFALHAYFWKAAPREMRPRFGRYAGRRCSWRTPRHEPEWPDEFARVARTVRAAGMKLVVYLSPLHSRTPDLSAEVRRALRRQRLEHQQRGRPLVPLRLVRAAPSARARAAQERRGRRAAESRPPLASLPVGARERGAGSVRGAVLPGFRGLGPPRGGGSGSRAERERARSASSFRQARRLPWRSACRRFVGEGLPLLPRLRSGRSGVVRQSSRSGRTRVSVPAPLAHAAPDRTAEPPGGASLPPGAAAFVRCACAGGAEHRPSGAARGPCADAPVHDPRCTRGRSGSTAPSNRSPARRPHRTHADARARCRCRRDELSSEFDHCRPSASARRSR